MAEKKTAQDRARELVETSQVKVDRLQKRHDKAKAEYDKVAPLLEEAKAELEFAKSHPALRNVANESDTAAETVEAAGLVQAPAEGAIAVADGPATNAAVQPPAEQEAPAPAPAQQQPVAAGAQGTDPFADFG